MKCSHTFEDGHGCPFVASLEGFCIHHYWKSHKNALREREECNIQLNKPDSCLIIDPNAVVLCGKQPMEPPRSTFNLEQEADDAKLTRTRK